MTDVDRKLAAARTRLILDKPFLGALVLRLPLVASTDNWCATTATDARSFYYSPDYIDQLSLEQVQFVLSHEALHCGLSHFARRQSRDTKRWDIACDYAVNQLLMQDGIEPPPGALHDDSFDGMTAEEIYPFIKEATAEEPMDQHLYDGSPANPDTVSGRKDRQSSVRSGRPPPLTETERYKLDNQWQQRLAGAAQQAQLAGRLDERMARLVAQLLRPSLPWRAILARFMNGASRTDYNLLRPSQRREGDAIMPSLHLRKIDLVVALDTSGSISGGELNEFVAELNAIKSSMNARITLLACDSTLDDNAPWIFESWESMQLPDGLQGGGKTDFTPVFNWVDCTEVPVDLIVYFTDARGKFPQYCAIPTLWLVKGSANVPWGQRIQLN